MASGSLLSTKLFAPQAKAGLVLRPRLTERIKASVRGKLTLVSAPAGFGKTTLLTSWVSETEQDTAWVSLDEADNEPRRFLGHVAAALGAFRAQLDKHMTQLVKTNAPIDALLTNLVNELALEAKPLSLVLDDYHVIQNESVHKALTFLLEHAPRHFTVLMTTRNDPPLPLARWRVRGELTELRTLDLRFSFEETHQFLQGLGLELAPEDVESLEQRTEGWAVGLQLAALSLQQEEDKTAFIQEFAGDHRYVLDYLMDEVLERQDENVQTFLLKTSILGRLCSSLCDAVVYPHSGQQHTASSAIKSQSETMLGYLERANLFLIPLDTKREWYRYHHLFADLLRLRLHKEFPALEKELHLLAAAWYETRGYTSEALTHLLAAKQFAQAGKLVELMGEDALWGRGDVTTLDTWLSSLPSTTLHSSAKLCLLKVWTHYQQGQFQDIEALLASAETLIKQVRQDSPNDEDSLAAMGGEILAIRSFMIRLAGELEKARHFSLQALEQLPPHAARIRGLVMANIAECSFLTGDLATAETASAQASAVCLAAGNIFPGLFLLHRLATTQMLQGHLNGAAATCEQMRSLVQAPEHRHVAGLADIQLGLLEAERNHLEAARQHLEAGIKQGKHVGNLRIFYHGLVGLADVLADLEQDKEATIILEEAEGLEQHHAITWTWGMPSAALAKANFLLRQGKPEPALQWLDTGALSASHSIPYQHEDKYLVIAKALLVSERLSEASRLLETLYQATSTGKRAGRVIRVLVLKALVLQAQQKMPGALETLKQALDIAEPEGYLRVFLDEGKAMQTLLQYAVSKNGTQPYLQQLLAAFTPSPSTPSSLDNSHSTPSPSSQLVGVLESDLNERELVILRLMSGRLSDKEIASQLDLSVNTVKWYARNIYEKLGVHKRTSAVTQAKRMGLL